MTFLIFLAFGLLVMSYIGLAGRVACWVQDRFGLGASILASWFFLLVVPIALIAQFGDFQ